MTEDEKQKYFEEGYDQCYREVVAEIKSWNHPDGRSFIMWLNKTFKLSAEKLSKGVPLMPNDLPTIESLQRELAEAKQSSLNITPMNDSSQDRLVYGSSENIEFLYKRLTKADDELAAKTEECEQINNTWGLQRKRLIKEIQQAEARYEEALKALQGAKLLPRPWITKCVGDNWNAIEYEQWEKAAAAIEQVLPQPHAQQTIARRAARDAVIEAARELITSHPERDYWWSTQAKVLHAALAAYDAIGKEGK